VALPPLPSTTVHRPRRLSSIRFPRNATDVLPSAEGTFPSPSLPLVNVPFFMPRNKNRVYLALYERSATGGHHHMTIVLAPKAAGMAPLAHQSWRYRAARGTDQRWAFVAENVRNRSGKTRALVLLGKCTQSGEQLRDLLAGVPIARVDSCSGWTTEAIQVRALRSWPTPYIYMFPPLSLSLQAVKKN
jgi:hypothetical protein